jgi:membrane-associated phospholipid phosphatase
LNLAMLAAIPFVGGHYLADMIAGAGVALACIAAVTWTPRLWRSRTLLAQALPQAETA